MALRNSVRRALGAGLVLAFLAGSPSVVARQNAPAALGVGSARVTIAGTSNIHPYTASTTVVRVARAQLAATVAGPEFWDNLVKPGAIEAFEIAIPAATLASTKEGLDKNMHKALKTQEHPDITFRLARVETAAAGGVKLVGTLRIAGVEREVALNATTRRNDSGLTVKGELQLLMTDYGITPPKAMLGMLKTDPKVTVTFETVLAIPLT